MKTDKKAREYMRSLFLERMAQEATEEEIIAALNGEYLTCEEDFDDE